MSFPTPPSDRLASFSDQFPDGMSPRVLDFLFKGGRCFGTQKQTKANMVGYRSAGYSFPNLHYTLGLATYGPDAGMPDANAVRTIIAPNGDWGSRWGAYKSLNYLFQLNRETGKRKHNGQEKWWLLAISNTQCRQKILVDLLADIAAVPGTTGVFLDEFVCYTNRWFDGDENLFNGPNAANPAVWAPEPAWPVQMQGWLAYLTVNLHAKGLVVVANVGNLTTGWVAPPTGMDAAMIEQFANRGLYSGDDWTLAMNRCLNLGCPLILQSALSEVDRSFFFASALLLDNAYVNLCDDNSVGAFWWPEMEWLRGELGVPIDHMTDVAKYQIPGGAYLREFQRGQVYVNPSTAPITFAVPSMLPLLFSGGGRLADAHIDASGGYVGGTMTYGSPVGSVTLAPGTGMVLLDGDGPEPPATLPRLTLDLPGGERYAVTLTPIET